MTDNHFINECCWYGTLSELQSTPASDLLNKLISGHHNICNEAASSEQINAWRNCIRVLKETTNNLYQEYGVIFEYVLPRERGRRPDVLIISKSVILVLEFKDYERIRSAHIDQTAAYARDIADYHSNARDKEIHPVLVLTRAKGLNKKLDNVFIASPDNLSHLLSSIIMEDSSGNICDFLSGDYSPLPTLISAARLLFENTPLPQIRRAESAGIPQTLELLHDLANSAVSEQKKVLALVTGVPGSGKTLVGLQFVYDRSSESKSNAVFLSGNGPLVEVLQYTLKNRVFVQDVHGFLKQYGGNSTKTPSERVWIYDEAQRAWDNERSKEKRGTGAVSEPNDFLKLGDRTTGGVVVIGLIGEGQEIHLGEEAGIGQWNDAIGSVSGEWEVACPPHLTTTFTHAARCISDERLNLDYSLRTHRASELQEWVHNLLIGHISNARALSEKLRINSFPIYITRSIESAKRHAIERYRNCEDKRYGLLASSKANNLECHGIPNGFQATKSVRKGPWFSDPPSDPRSCCQLDSVATEFACQGLELDFPIVCWGDDLKWDEGWFSISGKSKARNPHALRLNSYRVLLTRGRDGMVIFVPSDPQMDSTWRGLIAAGVREFAVDP